MLLLIHLLHLRENGWLAEEFEDGAVRIDDVAQPQPQLRVQRMDMLPQMLRSILVVARAECEMCEGPGRRQLHGRWRHRGHSDAAERGDRDAAQQPREWHAQRGMRLQPREHRSHELATSA